VKAPEGPWPLSRGSMGGLAAGGAARPRAFEGIRARGRTQAALFGEPA